RGPTRTGSGSRSSSAKEHSINRHDIETRALQVAEAVDLAEGQWGVLDVITAIARHEPLAGNEISRHVELPVPIVAAICNELRQRDIVDTQRPVRLTASARDATAADTWLSSGTCPHCSGLGIHVPQELDRVATQLETLTEEMPE